MKVDKIVFFLSFSVLSVLGIYLHVSYLFDYHYIGSDDGLFLLIGSEILNGKLPYIDITLIKTPGITFLLALSFKLFGVTLETALFLVLIINLLTTYIIYLIGKNLSNEGVGLMAALTYVFGLLVYDGASIYTEPFLCFFTVMGVLSFLKFLDKSKKSYIILSGIFLGISLLFKQVAILTLVSVFFLYIVLGIKSKRPREIRDSLQELSLLSSGFIMPLLVLMFYFWVNGGLDDLIYNILILPFFRGFLQNNGDFMTLLRNSYTGFSLVPFIWLSAVMYPIILITADRYEYRKEKSTKELLLILWFIFSLVPTFVKQFPHYYIPALPSASLITSITVCATWNKITDLNWDFMNFKIISRIVLTMMIVTLFVLPVYEVISEDIERGIKQNGLEKELIVAEYIKSRTSSGEKVLIIGSLSGLYFLSDTTPAIANPIALVNPEKIDFGFSREKLIDEINRTKIRYILVIDPQDNTYYEPVFSFIKDKYELEKNYNLRLSFSNVMIYRLKSIPPPIEKHYSISAFENDELWDYGMFDSLTVKEGEYSLSLNPIGGGWSTSSRNVSLNLGAKFKEGDNIDIWTYTEDAQNIEQIGFSFYNDYEHKHRKSYYFTSDFKNGWRLYRLARMNYYTARNGSWDDLKKIAISVKSKPNKNATVIFDDWYISEILK